MSNRRIFTEEFKAGAVQLVVSSGRVGKNLEGRASRRQCG